MEGQTPKRLISCQESIAFSPISEGALIEVAVGTPKIINTNIKVPISFHVNSVSILGLRGFGVLGFWGLG